MINEFFIKDKKNNSMIMGPLVLLNKTISAIVHNSDIKNYELCSINGTTIVNFDTFYKMVEGDVELMISAAEVAVLDMLLDKDTIIDISEYIFDIKTSENLGLVI